MRRIDLHQYHSQRLHCLSWTGRYHLLSYTSVQPLALILENLNYKRRPVSNAISAAPDAEVDDASV